MSFLLFFIFCFNLNSTFKFYITPKAKANDKNIIGNNIKIIDAFDILNINIDFPYYNFPEKIEKDKLLKIKNINLIYNNFYFNFGDIKNLTYGSDITMEDYKSYGLTFDLNLNNILIRGFIPTYNYFDKIKTPFYIFRTQFASLSYPLFFGLTYFTEPKVKDTKVKDIFELNLVYFIRNEIMPYLETVHILNKGTALIIGIRGNKFISYDISYRKIVNRFNLRLFKENYHNDYFNQTIQDKSGYAIKLWLTNKNIGNIYFRYEDLGKFNRTVYVKLDSIVNNLIRIKLKLNHNINLNKLLLFKNASYNSSIELPFYYNELKFKVNLNKSKNKNPIMKYKLKFNIRLK